MKTKKAVADLFWRHVKKDGPVHSVLGTPCWLWTASTNHWGYGWFRSRGISRLAHRVSWVLAHPEAPPSNLLWVLHRCDNPPCVNPAHLFLGTAADNIADRDAKGRNAMSNKTHCPHGHEYTEANTFRRRNQRECRACARLRSSSKNQSGAA